jgi:hypothetical protein
MLDQFGLALLEIQLLPVHKLDHLDFLFFLNALR